MSEQGLFLTLEGIDGAGKSSHLDALEACVWPANPSDLPLVWGTVQRTVQLATS